MACKGCDSKMQQHLGKEWRQQSVYLGPTCYGVWARRHAWSNSILAYWLLVVLVLRPFLLPVPWGVQFVHCAHHAGLHCGLTMIWSCLQPHKRQRLLQTSSTANTATKALTVVRVRVDSRHDGSRNPRRQSRRDCREHWSQAGLLAWCTTLITRASAELLVCFRRLLYLKESSE